MAKTTLKELKRQIAGILDEAKKSKKSSSRKSSKSPQVEVYGYYDHEHNFAGEASSVGQAVNWGPGTNPSQVVHPSLDNPNGGSAANQMKESDEKALRSLVREVIQNGLIDESSAWAPFMKRSEPIFESTWDEAVFRMHEGHWFDKKDEADRPEGKAKGFEKDKDRGGVKGHGAPKSSKK